MLKLQTKSCLRPHFFESRLRRQLRALQYHLLHQAEGKSVPCGYQRRCTCASCFAYFLSWVYRKNKNPAKPLPHKICWPRELLYIAGDAPSQLRVQKSIPCSSFCINRDGHIVVTVWPCRTACTPSLAGCSRFCRSPLKFEEFSFSFN